MLVDLVKAFKHVSSKAIIKVGEFHDSILVKQGFEINFEFSPLG